MIKEQEAVTPSISSPPSRPILVIRSRPSTKRGDSARPRVTFSESTFKKEASSSKETTPIQNGGPIASNMTFGEFEAMVRRRMDAPKREDSSSRLNLRPQSVKLSTKGFNISERRNNALKPTLTFQKQERLASRQTGIRHFFIEYPISKVHQNDLGCEIETNGGPRDRSNPKVISKSLRDSLTKDFKIGTICPSPQKGISRVRSSGKFALGNVINTTIEDKDCLGINPEVGKRNPNLAKSLHKLKKIGFPEKNIKALVRYANQNDREVIKGVSRVANSDPEQVIGNIETLLYERKQVEAIDQWEDQQKLRIKIRSALEGRPRLGTAS